MNVFENRRRKDIVNAVRQILHGMDRALQKKGGHSERQLICKGPAGEPGQGRLFSPPPQWARKD